jgi:hypothetical protein
MPWPLETEEWLGPRMDSTLISSASFPGAMENIFKIMFS